MNKIFCFLALVMFSSAFFMGLKEPVSLVILIGISAILLRYIDKTGVIATCTIMIVFYGAFFFYFKSTTTPSVDVSNLQFDHNSLLVSKGYEKSGYQIKVPSDSKATYRVLDKKSDGAISTITTLRSGSSGESYSKRLYNCMDQTVEYLGTGDSLDKMNNSSPDKKMTKIVNGSIAFYIGREACK